MKRFDQRCIRLIVSKAPEFALDGGSAKAVCAGLTRGMSGGVPNKSLSLCTVCGLAHVAKL